MTLKGREHKLFSFSVFSSNTQSAKRFFSWDRRTFLTASASRRVTPSAGSGWSVESRFLDESVLFARSLRANLPFPHSPVSREVNLPLGLFRRLLLPPPEMPSVCRCRTSSNMRSHWPSARQRSISLSTFRWVPCAPFAAIFERELSWEVRRRSGDQAGGGVQAGAHSPAGSTGVQTASGARVAEGAREAAGGPQQQQRRQRLAHRPEPPDWGCGCATPSRPEAASAAAAAAPDAAVAACAAAAATAPAPGLGVSNSGASPSRGSTPKWAWLSPAGPGARAASEATRAKRVQGDLGPPSAGLRPLAGCSL